MMTGTFTYNRHTIRVDGSTHDETLTHNLPYAHNGRWYTATDVWQLVSKWNEQAMPEYEGRLLNRYEYTLVDVSP